MENELQYELLPNESLDSDLTFKVVIIGDSGVGKSCLATRASKNYFEQFYQTTVGFEFFVFNIKINGKVIKLQIWDTCGQEIYRSLIPNFYRNSSLAVMVYSIDSLASFENIETWIKELKTQSNPDVKMFLIGNKADLEDKRAISKETAEIFQKNNAFEYFVETSAKTGFNAQNVFIEAAKSLYKDFILFNENSFSTKRNSAIKLPSVPVDENHHHEEEKKGCCS